MLTSYSTILVSQRNAANSSTEFALQHPCQREQRHQFKCWFRQMPLIRTLGNIGYILRSVYGSTADAGCSPIAFAMLFGNDDADGWSRFWTFARLTHGWLDDNKKLTIITDQDKGLSSAIAQILPLAGNYHCSFHWQTTRQSKFLIHWLMLKTWML